MGRRKRTSWSLQNLVHGRLRADAVAFANEMFHRARVLSFPIGDRTLWLTLHRPPADRGAAVNLLLRVGDHVLRVAMGQLADLVLLDRRFASLSLEIYEEDLQKLLAEVLLEPLLEAMGLCLGERIVLEEICLDADDQPAGKLPPFAIQFALYAANPHLGDPAPCLLDGVATMDEPLANLLLKKMRAVAPVRYHTYPGVVPRCWNVLASLTMAVDELRSLRVGDVILLEKPAENGGERLLLGIGPYAIDCVQEGGQLVVGKIRTRH
ncbi:MAG: hypothetical protein LBP65_02660 [Puniceicoccales bacterium]|jgi:hypothetical protein|nr:hypothetical protein [Puniceicoccales bacterium]